MDSNNETNNNNNNNNNNNGENSNASSRNSNEGGRGGGRGGRGKNKNRGRGGRGGGGGGGGRGNGGNGNGGGRGGNRKNNNNNNNNNNNGGRRGKGGGNNNHAFVPTPTLTPKDLASSGLTPTCHIINTNSEHELINLQDDTDALDHQYCQICYTPNLHKHRGITSCGHNDFCASCHLRQRSLHSDFSCPICKTKNEHVIIDTDNNEGKEEGDYQLFESYSIWGNELGGGFVYREDVGMFFYTAYYEQFVLPLFTFRCGIPSCSYDDQFDSQLLDGGNNNNNNNNGGGGGGGRSGRGGTLKALKHHLRTQHSPSLSICELCITNKRDFISKLPRMTPQQLKDHNAYGDAGKKLPYDDGGGGGDGGRKREENIFQGHPLCQFCDTRFYDLTQLHDHLNKNHEKCFVCDKLGMPHQFFKDYSNLALHFEKEHYACLHPDCLAARFVVFANEIDLRAHERNVHGVTGNAQIQLDFKVRSSGVDGSGRYSASNRDGGYGGAGAGANMDMERDFNTGLDGQVFVPEPVRQEIEPEITHQAHAERTQQFREEAARIRQEQGYDTYDNAGEEGDGGMSASNRGRNQESFPTLGDSNHATSESTFGWSSEGRTAVMSRNSGRTNATAMTAENFPTLGGTSSSSTNNGKKMSKLTKLTAKPQAATRQFAAIRAAASGTTTSFASASTPASATTTTTASSIISNRGASTSMDNFPALGGGTRSAQYTAAQAFTSSRRSTATSGAASRTAQVDMSANSFPSLGGGPSSNNSTRAASNGGYGAADALSKRLKNQANVSQNSSSLLDQHFPAAPTGKKKVLLSQKTAKPISRVALDNVLDFPAPPIASTSTNGGAYIEPAAATATKQSMKLKLGENRYKQLKKLTKSFGQEKVMSPEDYIDSTAALFHDGIQDELFLEFVPTLVSSCGIESISKRAMNHLENLRAASGIRSSTTAGAVKPPQSRSTWNGAGTTAASGKGGWNRTPTIAAAAPLSNNATTTTGTNTTTKKKKAKAKNNLLRDLAVTRK